MTIQIQTDDGLGQRTRTYRKVYKGVNLAEFVEMFFEMRHWNRWGELVQLKGTERIVLHRFGNKGE